MTGDSAAKRVATAPAEPSAGGANSAAKKAKVESTPANQRSIKDMFGAARRASASPAEPAAAGAASALPTAGTDTATASAAAGAASPAAAPSAAAKPPGAASQPSAAASPKLQPAAAAPSPLAEAPKPDAAAKPAADQPAPEELKLDKKPEKKPAPAASKGALAKKAKIEDAAAPAAAANASKAPAGASGSKAPVVASPRAGAAAAPSPSGKASGGSVARGGSASFSQAESRKARESLLGWYDRVHRTLPWRRNAHSKLAAKDIPSDATSASFDIPDQVFAYRVWVSEIMLQQTQVATVIAYFNKWIAKWPTVSDLAKATQEEVNQVWAGLGYYRRAKYLLDGAQYVMTSLGGKFPATAKQLLDIPGVGPYTAAAVGSIAFNDAAAAVDGNVIRVVSRLRALKGDPRKLAALHSDLAQQLLDPVRPGCFNQAMMELGATVCKPANPDCARCPVQSLCTAHADWQRYVRDGGDQDIEDAPRVTNYPEKVEKAAKKEQNVAVCVLRVLPAAGAAPGSAKPAKGKDGADDGSRYLLVQRPEGGLLAGLWEFPGVIFEQPELPYAKRQALMNGYLRDALGLDVAALSAGAAGAGATLVSRRALGEIVHIFSHIRQTMHVEQLTLRLAGAGQRPEQLLKPPAGGAAQRGFTGSATAASGDEDDDDAGISGGSESEGEAAAAAASPAAAKSAKKAQDLSAFDNLNDSDDDARIIARSKRPLAAAAEPPADAKPTPAGEKPAAAKGKPAGKRKASIKPATGGAGAGPVATQWIAAADLNASSVSTGVKKVFKLASAPPPAKETPSVSKFFAKKDK